MSKIKDILLDFVNIWSNQNNIYSKQCTVTSVDQVKRICTCSPVDGTADILEVQLESDITLNSDNEPIASDPKGFFIVPQIGSLVIVTFLAKDDAFISAWTEIKEVIVITPQFTFNDGAFGGLTKLSDLVLRIKEYESLFTQLKTDFNAWTPVPHDGGLALKTILISGFLTKTVPNSSVSEFENTNVIHG